MAERFIGECSECGKEEIEVTLIDEVTSLCADCIDELDYFECDECTEFWLHDAVRVYNLKDGRTLCEHCAEMLLEDEEITEDDIDWIEDDTE